MKDGRNEGIEIINFTAAGHATRVVVPIESFFMQSSCRKREREREKMRSSEDQ